MYPSKNIPWYYVCIQHYKLHCASIDNLLTLNHKLYETARRIILKKKIWTKSEIPKFFIVYRKVNTNISIIILYAHLKKDSVQEEKC